MGVIARYVKAAVERKRYQISYVNWLDTGEIVASVIFAVNKATVRVIRPPVVRAAPSMTRGGRKAGQPRGRRHRWGVEPP